MAIRKQHERREQESWRSARNEWHSNPKLAKERNARARRRATRNAQQERSVKRIGKDIFEEIGL